MKSYILSVLVNNNFGVLTRIAGLFARRGYNIKSLTVGETLDERVSRMTIECIGDEYTLNQIKCQLRKVEDVINVTELQRNSSVYRELFLVRVSRSGAGVRNAAEGFADCRVLSETATETVFEVCGESVDFEKFCEAMKEFGPLDVSRTGVTAITK